MDLILTLAEDQLIEFVWTEELLDEWERVIVEKGKRTRQSALSVAATVRESFKDSRIDPQKYRDKVWPELPDLDDRVHGAAASAGADVLLTRNLDDFPPLLLPKLIVTTSDEYLTSLFRHRPRDFVASLTMFRTATTTSPSAANGFTLVLWIEGEGLPSGGQLNNESSPVLQKHSTVTSSSGSP